jgi:hypothetical protein
MLWMTGCLRISSETFDENGAQARRAIRNNAAREQIKNSIGSAMRINRLNNDLSSTTEPAGGVDAKEPVATGADIPCRLFDCKAGRPG